MRTSRLHRTYRHVWWDGNEPFPRYKGGGATGTTAVIPDELKPLISHSVSGTIGLQPAAQDFFNAFSAASYANPQNQYNGLAPGQQSGSVYDPTTNSWSQPLQALQIAPLTGVENQLYNLGQQGTEYLGNADPGWFQAFRALNLDSPLTQLAGTLSPTPQATNYLQQITGQGFDTLNTPISQSPALAAFYQNLMNAQGQLGQQVGATSQEQGATSSLNSLTGVAGQPITTPDAETQALAQIGQLTGGQIGSSPATQQAIAALEQQYNTRALPSLQNQLAQAGLGRSGALEQGVADLRGQLFGAEVPLLQQEISNREQTLPILQSIAQAQQGRQTGATDRLIQALSTQASGLTNLGGQLGSRTQADIQRDLTAQLSASPQLQSQQQIENAAQAAPIERMISYIQSQFAPGVQVAAQETARLDKPIDRQLATAMQAASAFNATGQQQDAFAQLLGQIGAQPRLQNQAVNEAYAQNNQRQQALAESILLGPLGVLPSLIGSQTTSSGGK